MSQLPTTTPSRLKPARVGSWSLDRFGRRELRALGIAALAALAIWVFVFKASPRMPDFEVYCRAGARAAAAEPLYRQDDGHYQFKYLPVFAVLAIPVGLAPPETAEAIWFSVSVVALIGLLGISLRLLPEQRKPGWMLVAAAILVLGKFYARELVLGQVNLLFAAVATGAILALRMKREALAGVLVALAIVLKPYGLLLVPWLIARFRPRAMLGVGAGMVAAAVLPIVLYGVDGNVALHRDWLRTVVDTTAPNLPNVDNVSWLAMYTRWHGPGPAAPALAMPPPSPPSAWARGCGERVCP